MKGKQMKMKCYFSLKRLFQYLLDLMSTLVWEKNELIPSKSKVQILSLLEAHVSDFVPVLQFLPFLQKSYNTKSHR